jgi:hypothetical protein
VDENYCALYLSIIKGYTPDQSFMALNGQKPKSGKEDIRAETEDIAALRSQGKTWPEIEEIMGISRQAAFKRLQRYKGIIQEVKGFEAQKYRKETNISTKEAH